MAKVGAPCFTEVGLFEWLGSNYGLVLTICGALGIGLEVSPSKLRPVTWLLKRAGKIMNEEQEQRIKSLAKDFDVFKEKYDKEQICRIKKEISEFVLSLQRKEKHTKKDFERIKGRTTEYHDLLNKYGMQNGNIEIEQEYIDKIYLECLSENKFFVG